MDTAIPAWFQSDQIFCQGSKWFIGSEESLHIGPYRDETLAKSKSYEVSRRLKKLAHESDRLRYVRKLLSEEWDNIGAEAHLETEEISLENVEEQVRQGETQKKWYRSNRFFQVQGIWFFSTREGIDVGPFDSESHAREHEQKLKSLLIKCKDDEKARQTIMAYKHQPEKVTVEFEGYRQFSQARL